MKRRTDERRELLRHYFLTYFLVLLVPLVICCAYYFKMITMIGEDDLEARAKELEHAGLLTDVMLDELNYLGDNLSSNVRINSFRSVQDVFRYPDSYAIYELRSSLPDLYLTNQSIFDYFIFLDKSEIVINRTIIYSYQEFYELYLRDTEYETYEDWYRHMKQDKVEYGLTEVKDYVYKNAEPLRLIAYTRPFVSGTETDNSRVQILFEESVMENLMPVVSAGSIQYIKDFQDQLIYYKGDSEKSAEELEQMITAAEMQMEETETSGQVEILIDGEEYVALTCQSSEANLSYHILHSEEIINGRKITSFLVLGIFILIGITVGLVLCFHMSVRSATPINDILQEISRISEKGGDHQSVFSRLTTTFQYLLSTNHDLKREMDYQKPYIRTTLLNRLIYGKCTSLEEAERTAKYIGFEIRGKVFCVVIFHFHLISVDMQREDMELTSSCVLSLREVIDNLFPGSLFGNVEEDQVIWLLDFAEAASAEYKNIAENKIREIKEALPSNIAEKFFVYGGSIAEEIVQIKESYSNAYYTFYNDTDQIENEIIWYRGMHEEIPAYPEQEMLVRLTHYVTEGDEQGLHDILEEMMMRYIIRNNLSVYLQQMLVNELQVVLLRTMSRIGLAEEQYREIYAKLEESQNGTLIQQMSVTLNLYRDVCRMVNEKKNNTKYEMNIKEIAAYIDSNYGDSNLSLAGVADRFHFRETYLSSMFKQCLGINFSNYVEGVRIDKAKDFLRTTSLSVSDISGLVGYYSTNSFCRAFKRVTGISASEYRKGKI